MNLKDLMKNLTDEEICVMLKDLTDLQKERQQEVKVEPEEEHYYEFTGTWSWGVWAKSKEEAVERFNDTYIEDLNVLTDEYKVEQYE